MKCSLLAFFAFAALTAQAQPPTQKPCTGYQAGLATFEQAQKNWVEPACYTFSYAKVGMAASNPELVNVAVKNGVASTGLMTMADFFEMIETRCYASCPDSGAYQCTNEYAVTDGYPLSILVDESEFTAGEELRYVLSNFNEIDDCSSLADPTVDTVVSVETNNGKDDVEDVNDKDINVVGEVQGQESSAMESRTPSYLVAGCVAALGLLPFY